jgi:hypothetical protein
MTTERNAQGMDVLSLVKAQTAHYVALAQSDAYAAQEAPKWIAASLAIGELVEADRAFDAAQDAVCEAKRANGNWRVNPLGRNHPAVVAVRAAKERRAAALLPFQSEAES